MYPESQAQVILLLLLSWVVKTLGTCHLLGFLLLAPDSHQNFYACGVWGVCLSICLSVCMCLCVWWRPENTLGCCSSGTVSLCPVNIASLNLPGICQVGQGSTCLCLPSGGITSTPCYFVCFCGFWDLTWVSAYEQQSLYWGYLLPQSHCHKFLLINFILLVYPLISVSLWTAWCPQHKADIWGQDSRRNILWLFPVPKFWECNTIIRRLKTWRAEWASSSSTLWDPELWIQKTPPRCGCLQKSHGQSPHSSLLPQSGRWRHAETVLAQF